MEKIVTKTVHDLLLESPDACVPALQAAWKAAAVGNWMEVSKQLGFAAEHGDTAWHVECGERADNFYAKARAA